MYSKNRQVRGAFVDGNFNKLSLNKKVRKLVLAAEYTAIFKHLSERFPMNPVAKKNKILEILNFSMNQF